jgi:ribosomal protein S18 acetylase RimI-like enzyme
MTTQAQIRKAKQEDLSVLVDFQLNMALETENIKLDKEVLTKGMKAVLNDDTKGQYFIAEMGGVVSGSLMITYEWSDWRNGMIWWIQSVYVSPQFRGQKVYSALYNYIKETVLADPSLRGIRLYVDKTNLKAQQVYTTLGMNGEHYATFEWMKG